MCIRDRAEADRVERGQRLGVPVGAVADLRDGRLGRADQADDLRVLELGMVAQQPEDGVRTVLALRDRGVARALGALDLRHLHLALGELEVMIWVLGGALQLLAGELPGGDGVEALDAGGDFAIGDAADFERMQLTEFGDLLEGQGGCLLYTSRSGSSAWR